MDTSRLITMNAPAKISRFETMTDKYAQIFGKSWLPWKDSGLREIPINDLPFMIRTDGTVVCIPKLPEMGCIAAIGLTGTGKTAVSGYMVDNIFWNWNDSVAVMNDSQEETFTWSEPDDNPEFVMRIRKLNQIPYPLPMVYVFPNFENFKIKEEILSEKNSLVVSIPIEEVIENIDKYIPDLDKSKKYIMDKKEELLSVETEEELYDIISSIDTGTKGMAEVKNKVMASFRNLINEGIINISNKSSHYTSV